MLTNVYEKYILPRLIDLVMQNKAATAKRAAFVPLASGRVLEVGIGSGLNVPFYSLNVEKLYGLDPSPDLWKIARRRAACAPFPIEFVASSGESIAAENEAFDTVISTWTLCTIPNALRALKEMKRVLKPGGRFIFIEHGWSPDAGVQAWQNWLNPVWTRISGGCNLNRKIDKLILEGGFRVIHMERGDKARPKSLVYPYRGIARPAD